MTHHEAAILARRIIDGNTGNADIARAARQFIDDQMSLSLFLKIIREALFKDCGKDIDVAMIENAKRRWGF